jgi:hypothetical protein
MGLQLTYKDPIVIADNRIAVDETDPTVICTCTIDNEVQQDSGRVYGYSS